MPGVMSNRDVLPGVQEVRAWLECNMHAAGLFTLHRRRKRLHCPGPAWLNSQIVDLTTNPLFNYKHADRSNILWDGFHGSRSLNGRSLRSSGVGWQQRHSKKHIHSITSRNDVHIIPAAPARMPAAFDREPILLFVLEIDIG